MSLISSLTFPQLHAFICSGVWRNDPQLWVDIYDRYLTLINEGQTFDDFGNPSFWRPDFDSDVETEERWLTEQEYIDQGGEGQSEPEVAPSEVDLVISESYRQEVKKLRTFGVVYDVKFTNLDNCNDIQEATRQGFDKIIDKVREEGGPNDKIGMEIHHPALQTPVLIPFRRQEDLDSAPILHAIEKIAQSKTEFCMDDNFEVHVVRISDIAASGRNKRPFRGNFEAWYKEKTKGHGSCMIKIENNDSLCMARAIVTARAHFHRNDTVATKATYNILRQGDRSNHTAQKRCAKQLMIDAGLADHQGPCSIPELKKLQTVVPEYQIKMWSKNAFYGKVFTGPPSDKTLHLFYHDGHVDVITSVAPFFDNSYYCEDCEKVYNIKERHLCSSRCTGCLSSTICPEIDDEKSRCLDCNRWFFNNACFTRHKSNVIEGMSRGPKTQRIVALCDKFKRCKDCGKVMRGTDHQCGTTTCKVCFKNVVPGNHLCHMTPQQFPKNRKLKDCFIFFDFETTQCYKKKENAYGTVWRHVVNAVISWKVCDKCWKIPESTCIACGADKIKEFNGEGCLDDFAKYLFSKENKNCTAIAHNGKSFDCQFLLEYIYRQGRKPEIVNKGLAIMELKFEGIRVIDSLNFLPMSLSDFPKTFGFTETKGHFPHSFNNPNNMNYVGDLPEKHYYCPGSMKPKKREEFEKWHDEEDAEMKRTGRRFVFIEELLKYCRLDVLVLLKGTMMFREQFMAAAKGVDPLLDAMTIAKACMLVYVRNFLPHETIGLVPHLGYRKMERQSALALKFMEHYSIENDLTSKGQYIQHARNEGEFHIGPYKVDGLLKTIEGVNLKKVLEVHGCFHHGCIHCFSDRTKEHFAGLTAHELYQRTLDRTAFIIDQGYTVHEVWECEINRMLKENPEMKLRFMKSNVQDPIDIREAFFGGRTNATTLLIECGPNEKCHHLDICSLYPWVCKNGEFPVSHPTILTENFETVTAENRPYRGFIKCWILPPRGLYHPVLPYRSKGKLTFPLCAKCVDERNQEQCHHSDMERRLLGTWTTLELYKALEHGYHILEIHEVWHYTKWLQFDGIDPKSGLFTDYVNMFLKIKTEASGWPDWAKTEDDKIEFIRLYKEKEGIQLNPDKIQKNPGLRQVAKLCLNSFWGKFGQRNNLTKLEYFTDLDEYFEVTFNDLNIISAVRIVAPEMVGVSYQKIEEVVESLPHTSPVIASYVTAQARLKLLTYLEKLEKRVAYFDTDSVVYITRPYDTYEPHVGDYLGDMTDELSGYGAGSYIQTFVAGGPKNYGYRIWSVKDQKFVEKVKIRGFTLNSSVANDLNFGTLKKFVETLIRNGVTDELTVYIQRIEKTPEREVLTMTTKKVYRIVYDKRRLLPNSANTVPFGY